MSILMWEKPEKILSTDEWKAISADGAPPGVYTSNMSKEDRERFKAKLVRPKAGPPRVEIRVTVEGVQVVVVVAEETVPPPPYPWGNGAAEDRAEQMARVEAYRAWEKTPGALGFQMSMNGTVSAPIEWYLNLTVAVAEARVVLAVLASPVRVGETIELQEMVDHYGPLGPGHEPATAWRPYEVIRLSREGGPVVRLKSGAALTVATGAWRKPA